MERGLTPMTDSRAALSDPTLASILERVMRCLLVILALGALGCDESPTGPTIPLNRDFELGLGETAIIEDVSMSVRFNGVSNDSRCPADAFCILGGDALVHITATSRQSTREYDLHTGDMRPVQHEGVTIALVQLQPYPFSSRTIAPADYRATLKVTR
jgi:hypothetical protein